MNALIGALLPLGVAAALSPMPLIALIVALFSERRALNGAGFLLGSLLATAALTAVATALSFALPNDPDATSHPVAGALRIVLGAAMIVFGAVTWRGRPRPGEAHPTPSWMARIESIGPLGAIGFGALLSAANVKNLPIQVAAGTHLAQSGSVTDAVIGGVIFVVLACGALGTVLFAALVFPTRTEAPLRRLRETLIAHNAVILTVVFVLAGTSMIGHGIAAL